MEHNIEIFTLAVFSLLYFFRHDPLITYPLISGFFVMLFPQTLNAYMPDPGNLYAISCMSARAIAFLLVLMIIPFHKRLFNLIPHLSMISCLIMLWHRYTLGYATAAWGFGLNSSMDGALLAFTYPLVIQWSSHWSRPKWLKYLYLILPVLAILITKSSVGVGGLCLGLALLYSRKSLKWLLIPASLFAIAAISNPNLFYENGRFKCWVWSMNWWWDNANIWFGTGYGTYGLLGPMIQILTKNHLLVNGQPLEAYYYEMHNDWLQGLFELGIIGILILLYLFARSLIRTWDRPHLFASIAVFGAVAGLNFPSYGPMTLFFAVILYKAIDNN